MSLKNIFYRDIDSYENASMAQAFEASCYCSICALEIENYVPDYFCGELINPACNACKDKADIVMDPFSSFPADGLPCSLLSH